MAIQNIDKTRGGGNLLAKYSTEKEGQIAFFKTYQPYISQIKDKTLEDILLQYTDGLIGGNILEFKLNISDINKVLFQTIKYLSKCRINGIPVPANILLISLNNSIVYKFDSAHFLSQIETLYIGASSQNNANFNTQIRPQIIDFSNDLGKANLIEILRQNNYTKININEDSILGWAKKYYTENPKLSKGSFLGTKDHQLFPNDGEIRNPQVFKDYILPYKEKDNEKFKYLMDTLNDKLAKKELGAFYTPAPYCKMAAQMVQEAIKLVPQGNDYIILDRCSGTGNLQEFLTDEELSHCVLSTFEYYEYHVLKARLGSKVRHIIPADENDGSYLDGKLRAADAMSEEYVKNPYLQSIIDNPKITIIMLENPPYKNSGSEKEKNIKGNANNNFVTYEMKKEIKGRTTDDLSNKFIWSAFKYYLRQPTDSYIVFSPVKYFKSTDIINKTFIDGYLLNRKHFHASTSSISLIMWQNIHNTQQKFNLKAFDIETDKTTSDKQGQVNNGMIKYEKDVFVNKVFNTFIKYHDRRTFNDDIKTDVICNGIGYQDNQKIQTIYNQNIVAYLSATDFAINHMKLNLLSRFIQNGKVGFYLRSDNYIEKLPLFCAKLYPQANWYERDVYFTTADGGLRYLSDEEFLKNCFIFTCLSQRNKCISFVGSDDRFYKNELCFDTETLASQNLKTLKLSDADQKLLDLWDEVLSEGKKCAEYKADKKYGTYQIIQELNTFYKNDKDKKIYNYPVLNTKLNSLKEALKIYYANNIEQKLFEYELLK